MSWTYGPTQSPPTNDGRIDLVRLLLPDTDPSNPLWQDEEIEAAYAVQASLYIGRNLPVSPLRVAALLLDALASNYARLSNVTKLLDVTLSPAKIADLKAQAASYRDQDDQCGAIIVEQVLNGWNFRERWIAQAQRRGA